MKRHIPVQIEWHPDPAQAVPVYRQILEWMYGKMEKVYDTTRISNLANDPKQFCSFFVST